MIARVGTIRLPLTFGTDKFRRGINASWNEPVSINVALNHREFTLVVRDKYYTIEIHNCGRFEIGQVDFDAA